MEDRPKRDRYRRMLHPLDGAKKFIDCWDGVPLLPTHRSYLFCPPDMPHLGHVANAHVGRNDELAADLRFDVAQCNKLEPRLVPKLLRGEYVACSCGYDRGASFRVRRPGGIFRGEPYDTMAYNAVPDHVAVSVDRDGVFNAADGCGVGLADYGTLVFNVPPGGLAMVQPLRDPQSYTQNPAPQEPPSPGDLTRGGKEDAGRSYNDLIDELRTTMQPRGGLLRSTHEPSLRERLYTKPIRADLHPVKPLRDPQSYAEEE
jgi:hypothetical protein